uniref:Toll-like receptor 4 isoform X1 n=1 Tax=Crassostrea virginica TaxID=6565 RepID=A0A8B8CE22_CRAVI|nr:toll-like receptor 4 isoform X1 [Crassostrea virginica]
MISRKFNMCLQTKTLDCPKSGQFFLEGLRQLAMLHVFLLLAAAFVHAEEVCRENAGCLYEYYNATWPSADCSSRNLTVPPCFNKEMDLVSINLRNNFLTEIPRNLPKLIKNLDLSHNSISGIGTSLLKYRRLEYLNLDWNRLNGSTLPSFPSTLVFLSLKGNQFKNYSRIYLSGLGSLFRLRVDGLKDGNLGKMFSDINTTVHSLKILDLSGRDGNCNMPNLTTIMFKKFNLTHLDISQCGLLNIEIGTLVSQQHLHFLDASYNKRLGFRGLQIITQDLQNTSLKILNVSKIHCSFGIGTLLTLQHTKYLKFIPLEELYLDSNRLELIEIGVVTYNSPKSLKVLSLGDNKLDINIYMLEAVSLYNLEVLNVSFQSLSKLNNFDFCYDIADSCTGLMNQNQFKLTVQVFDVLRRYYPFLPNNSLGVSMKSQDPNYTFHLPRNLQTIYANDIKFQYNVGEQRFGGQCKLKHIHFQNNFLYKIYGPIFGCNNVTYVDISNNHCSYISRYVFSAEPMLEVLKISQNLLGSFLKREVGGELLGHNKRLTVIDLHDNKITELPQRFFENNTMIQILNISHNNIEHWTVDMRHMDQFQLLDLSYNQLQELDERAMKLFPEHDNFTIMLQGNPLSCTCKNQHFLSWINSFPTSRFPNLSKYQCTYKNGSKLLLNDLPVLLAMLRKDCYSYSLIIIFASLFICMTTSLIIYRIIYRYRWKILYIYYLTKRILLPETKGTNRKKHYESDAFISYADSQRAFVVNMARRLENNGLNICIHDRDFVPGVDIAENITNAIHNSRQIVFVITPAFLKSYWCMFELNMARMESIYTRGGENIMLLVLLDNDVIKEMPRSLLDIVESKSYLEYPDDDSLSCSSVFWENLVDAIQDKD